MGEACDSRPVAGAAPTPPGCSSPLLLQQQHLTTSAVAKTGRASGEAARQMSTRRRMDARMELSVMKNTKQGCSDWRKAKTLQQGSRAQSTAVRAMEGMPSVRA